MMTQITKWLCGGIDLMWTFSLNNSPEVVLDDLGFFSSENLLEFKPFLWTFYLGVTFLRPGDISDIVFQPFDISNSDLKWDPRSELKYTWSGLIPQTNHGGVLQWSVCIHLPMTRLKNADLSLPFWRLTMFFSDREVPRRSQLRKEELPRRMEKVLFEYNGDIFDTLCST